jgi:hypothetical protein
VAAPYLASCFGRLFKVGWRKLKHELLLESAWFQCLNLKHDELHSTFNHRVRVVPFNIRVESA